MKKLVLLGAVAALVLSSCSKERTCTCTDKDGSKTVTTAEGKKKDAKIECEGSDLELVGYEYTDEDGNVYTATDAEITEWNKDDSDETCTLD